MIEQPDAAVELRRIRRILTGLVIMMVVAAVIGVVYWQDRREKAEQERLVDRMTCSLARDSGDRAAVAQFCDD